MLVFEGAGFFRLVWVRLLLQIKYRFARQGQRILGTGEALFPDFVRGNIRLLADYESLVGFTLSAESAEADTFLRWFAARHAQPTVQADGHATRK